MLRWSNLRESIDSGQPLSGSVEEGLPADLGIICGSSMQATRLSKARFSSAVPDTLEAKEAVIKSRSESVDTTCSEDSLNSKLPLHLQQDTTNIKSQTTSDDFPAGVQPDAALARKYSNPTTRSSCTSTRSSYTSTTSRNGSLSTLGSTSQTPPLDRMFDLYDLPESPRDLSSPSAEENTQCSASNSPWPSKLRPSIDVGADEELATAAAKSIRLNSVASKASRNGSVVRSRNTSLPRSAMRQPSKADTKFEDKKDRYSHKPSYCSLVQSPVSAADTRHVSFSTPARGSTSSTTSRRDKRSAIYKPSPHSSISHQFSPSDSLPHAQSQTESSSQAADQPSNKASRAPRPLAPRRATSLARDRAPSALSPPPRYSGIYGCAPLMSPSSYEDSRNNAAPGEAAAAQSLSMPSEETAHLDASRAADSSEDPLPQNSEKSLAQQHLEYARFSHSQPMPKTASTLASRSTKSSISSQKSLSGASQTPNNRNPFDITFKKRLYPASHPCSTDASTLATPPSDTEAPSKQQKEKKKKNKKKEKKEKNGDRRWVSIDALMGYLADHKVGGYSDRGEEDYWRTDGQEGYGVGQGVKWRDGYF